MSTRLATFLFALTLAAGGCHDEARPCVCPPVQAMPVAPTPPPVVIPTPAPPTPDAVPAPTPQRSAADVLAAEGKFSWSDGSTVYTMERDHSFHADPADMSGQTIAGTWTFTDEPSMGNVRVIGRWGWMNGASRSDDYRRMEFHVGDVYAAPVGEDRLYHPYFVMDSLAPTSAAEFARAVPNAAAR